MLKAKFGEDPYMQILFLISKTDYQKWVIFKIILYKICIFLHQWETSPKNVKKFCFSQKGECKC